MDSLLAPYRVLDLTDAKGFLCGKILGDLGADIIKIERPRSDEEFVGLLADGVFE